MIQKDEELLLKDLCARLPYGVLVHYCNKSHTLYTNDFILNERLLLEFRTPDGCVELRPYLRLMSSMTEDEKKEIVKPIRFDFVRYTSMSDVIDWLNANHFDYRGLIEKGLAIKVTEENNPYKE